MCMHLGHQTHPHCRELLKTYFTLDLLHVDGPVDLLASCLCV